MIGSKVKKALIESGISKLNDLQKDVFREFNCSESNIIVSAGTGAGKTEAVLVPIINDIIDKPRKGVKVIYVMPLIALANDQFTRIEAFTKKFEIEVFKYHKDVSASKKQRFFKDPDDILIITPESLQSILRKDLYFVENFFSSLEYFVIDEIHSFLNGPRGMHVQNIMWFIKLFNDKFRILALSATIEFNEDVKEYISNINRRPVKLIKHQSTNEKKFHIVQVSKTNGESYKSKKIVENMKREKAMYFFDSKKKLELQTAELNSYGDEVLVHHGNISAVQRKYAEDEIKRIKSALICCTSTLELGIDIGDVDRVYFNCPPSSVGSLLQRVGRSGRRTKISEGIIFTDDAIETLTAIVSIALAKKGIVEPYTKYKKNFSKLYHTVLNYINLYKKVEISMLYDIISTNYNYFDIQEDEFFEFIDNLVERKHLFKNKYNEIELDIDSERLIDSLDFLAYFDSKVNQYDVVAPTGLIGYIEVASSNLFVGKVFILQGKAWKVINVRKNYIDVIGTNIAREALFVPSFAPRISDLIKEYLNLDYINSVLSNIYMNNLASNAVIEYEREELKKYEYKIFLNYSMSSTFDKIIPSSKNYKNEYHVCFESDKELKYCIDILKDNQNYFDNMRCSSDNIKFTFEIGDIFRSKEIISNTYDIVGLIGKLEKQLKN